MPKLKVYRTPIGFHDAYVAAPSMKAALKAWGTEKNLFARGAAELVTDPKLTEEPLASPGEVIKRPRGSAAEHRKAAGSADRPERDAKSTPERKSAKRKPPPDRKPLETAERALSAAHKRFGSDLADIDDQLAMLQEKRRKLARAQETQIDKLEKERSATEAAYRRALDTWEA